MARLTDEERSFRKNGAGAPLSRIWHILVVLIALLLAAATVPDMLTNCLGHPLESGSANAKGAGLVKTVLAVPCSPYLWREGFWGRLLFLAI